MSGVLEVMDRAARRYATGSQASQSMREARATVAELIEALSGIVNLAGWHDDDGNLLPASEQKIYVAVAMDALEKAAAP